MKNLDTIVKELIALDPGFAAHESELRTLIAEFVAKKPDTHLDEEFVASLRARLQGASLPSPYASFYSHVFSAKYAILGVLAVLVIVPIGYGIATRGNSTSAGVFAMNQEIKHAGANAFGAIRPAEGAQGDTREIDPAASPVENVVATFASGKGGGVAVDTRMMLPQGEVTSYTYTYKGSLDLEAAGDVYQRDITQQSSAQIAAQLKKFNFGLANLASFSDTRVRSFELVEDKPFGYSIMANFDEGNISINADYTKWPSLSGKDMGQLPMSAMPSDPEAIAIANDFLKSHGISLKNYGDPVVQQYAEMGIADTGMQYAPEQLTVSYPLKISDAKIYEEGGYPFGLQVGVGVRDKKVMSVYGLTSQTYTSSSYSLETDQDKILSIVRKGGVHAWTPQESDGVKVKHVELELGEPEKVLLHAYNYKEMRSQELFVPALNFPVINAPAGENAPKSILIPLVPELLTQESGPVLYDMMR